MKKMTFGEFVRKAITFVPRRIYRFLHRTDYYYNSRLKYPYRGYEAMQYILQNCNFKTVIDIGCGMGEHAKIFLDHDKDVTTIDYGKSPYFINGKRGVEVGI